MDNKIYKFDLNGENIKIGTAKIINETQDYYEVVFLDNESNKLFNREYRVNKEWFYEKYPKFFRDIDELYAEAELCLIRDLNELRAKFMQLEDEYGQIRERLRGEELRAMKGE